jgi:hypothetical protein
MKTILEFLAKNNRWAIVLVLILLLLGGGIMKIQRNKINDLKDKYQSEVNLRKALSDSLDIYQNKEGEWVAEKRTIQATIKELEAMNGELTADQKRLLAKIKEVNKENSIITAALIRANFVIDSLVHGGLVVVDTVNKTVDFIEPNNPDIRYNFHAMGVLPFPRDSKPTLLIKNLTLPNEQFVEFHWMDNKKEGHPIAFSVTNSNKYVKVYDVNSYAIPELKKEIINPTGWEKVEQWLTKNGKIVGYVAGGVVIGAGGTYILMK